MITFLLELLFLEFLDFFIDEVVERLAWHFLHDDVAVGGNNYLILLISWRQSIKPLRVLLSKPFIIL